MACSLLPVLSMRWLRPSGKPAVTKVTIYQVTKRPWGELVTDARVDGREYVGQQEWRLSGEAGGAYSVERVPSGKRGPNYILRKVK